MNDRAAESLLPEDGTIGALVGRVHLGAPANGPAVVKVTAAGLEDVTQSIPTIADLLRHPEPAACLDKSSGPVVAELPSLADAALLAPADLQPIKACGVTFAKSMLERLIEERAKGDSQAADQLRRAMADEVGGDIAGVVPGSDAAVRVKASLQERGLWSQYLEVGLGKDAEIFTKAAPMSSVGAGAEIGLHPASTWNNPEPELVLAIAPSGKIVGATLGNDVNLRDVEGRSALLLGRAKDNNAACAIGPFLRLVDESFGIDHMRAAEVGLTIEGEDGFQLQEVSSLSEISRDIGELAAQAFDCHQFPDGLFLFTGTMFAPIQDRDTPGEGFTHRTGDRVTISSPKLGRLSNRVTTSDRAADWSFGLRDLMQNLADRGLLRGSA